MPGRVLLALDDLRRVARIAEPGIRKRWMGNSIGKGGGASGAADKLSAGGSGCVVLAMRKGAPRRASLSWRTATDVSGELAAGGRVRNAPSDLCLCSHAQSVQTFGRKVSRVGGGIGQPPRSRLCSLELRSTLQKTAVAVAHCKSGNGSIKLNGKPFCDSLPDPK